MHTYGYYYTKQPKENLIEKESLENTMKVLKELFNKNKFKEILNYNKENLNDDEIAHLYILQAFIKLIQNRNITNVDFSIVNHRPSVEPRFTHRGIQAQKLIDEIHNPTVMEILFDDLERLNHIDDYKDLSLRELYLNKDLNKNICEALIRFKEPIEEDLICLEINKFYETNSRDYMCEKLGIQRGNYTYDFDNFCYIYTDKLYFELEDFDDISKDKVDEVLDIIDELKELNRYVSNNLLNRDEEKVKRLLELRSYPNIID